MPDLPSSPPADSSPALALVHEGWNHIKRQRPVAAWACWRQALRFEPEHKAATHALNILTNAPDLPDAARAEYRFLTPVDTDQRTRWDTELRSQDLGDLAVAALSFGRLAEASGGGAGRQDGRARFNQGLCLTWLGENAVAITALDEAVGALAEDEPGVALDAWSLAEILRQGVGAETLADDLNQAVTFTWADGSLDPVGWLVDRPEIRPIPTPVDPATGQPTRADVRLFEWLDGVDPAVGNAAGGMVRRLLATAIETTSSLRLSGPDPALLETAVQEVIGRVGPGLASLKREATPLPLAFLDAAVWAIRLPVGIDPEEADMANRAAVERYYETVWIHRPRLGLDGHSPLDAARLALAGDLGLAAKLAAVIRVREQLGARPSTLRLYQGYPFDRLRRRLGLPPVNPEAVDPADTATMSATDLDALDPRTMSELDLVEAFESAAAFGDDARTARFAAWIADLDPDQSAATLRKVDLSALIATLIRQALADDEQDVALDWIDRGLVLDQIIGASSQIWKFTTWRAEILARTGQPAAALETYRAIIEARPTDAARALDAAETMLDNGHDDEGRTLTLVALEIAQEIGDEALADRIESLL